MGRDKDKAAPKLSRRITARKYMGDDAGSWAVFVDGRPFVTGLTRPEVAYHKRRAQEVLNGQQ